MLAIKNLLSLICERLYQVGGVQRFWCIIISIASAITRVIILPYFSATFYFWCPPYVCSMCKDYESSFDFKHLQISSLKSGDLGGHHGITPKREITLSENVYVVRIYANAQQSTALIAILLNTYNNEMAANQSVVMHLQ